MDDPHNADTADDTPEARLGAELRRLRVQAGLSMRQLAQALHRAHSTISDFENGRRLAPVEVVEQYEEYFGLSRGALGAQRERARVERLEWPRDGTVEEHLGDIDCPYKGLHPFDCEDAALFFGREAQVERVLARLAEARFVAVLGASGSGKSSFVRAGLLAGIRATDRGATARVAPLTPGERPVEELARAVSAQTGQAVRAEDLRADPGRLERAAREAGGAGLVVVVDQFEELFTLCREEVDRRCFVDALMAAWRDPASPVVVIVALRADFYGRVATYPELAAAVVSHQALIGPLAPSDLRRAIELPAACSGLQLQLGLAQTMLEDLADEPGALPLLSHALLETWKRRRPLMLTVSGYREAGGVRGAIAKTAEDTLQTLPDGDREIARFIFLSLTDVAEGVEPTRRRIDRAELAAHPQFAQSLDRVLGILADARLVTIGERTVELAHDALIRHWPRLRGWIDADREGLLIHRRLTGAARDWDTMDREPGALYRGSRLTAASEWASEHVHYLSRLENDFLTASQATERSELEAAKRSTRRRRTLALGLGAFFLISAIAAIVAIHQTDETRRAARVGASRQLSSEAEDRAASDPSLSVLLSLAASNSADTPEARRSLQSQIVRQRHVQRILTGHSGPVGALAYSPDGRLLAAAGPSGITVWDRRGRIPPARLRQPTGPVRAVSFSRDGHLLAAGGDEGIAVWDMTASDHRRVRRAWQDRVGSLAISPDGRRIAFAGLGASVIVQDVVGRHRETIRIPGTSRVDRIAITPDSRRAVTVGDGAASVWNLATLAQERRFRFRVRARGTKTGLALTPDGRTLATYSGTDTELWDMARGTKLNALALGGENLPLAFRPGGETLAAAIPGDHSTQIVTYRLGPHGFLKEGAAKSDETLPIGQRNDVSSVAYSPDGRTLASGSKDGTVTLWDPATPDTIGDSKLRRIDTVAFNPTGKILALGGAPRKGATVTGAVSFVDVARRRTILHVPCLRFADPRPHTSMWALAGDSCGGGLGVIDPSRPKGHRRVAVLHPRSEYRRQLFSEGSRFSPDGRLLAEQARPYRRLGNGKLSLTDKELLLWDPATPRVPVAHLKVAPPELLFSSTPAESFAFSPNGRTLAIGRSYDRSATDVGDDDKVLLWDTHQRATTATIKMGSYIYSIAFDPSSATLAVGLEDRVEVWRLSDRKRVAVIGDVHGFAQQLAFTPVGAKLAVADTNGVQLWTLNPVAPSGVRLPGNQGSDANATQFAFALRPDGRALAVADGSQAVVVWNLSAETWHRQLCHILDRDFSRSERIRFLPTDQRSKPTCPEGLG